MTLLKKVLFFLLFSLHFYDEREVCVDVPHDIPAEVLFDYICDPHDGRNLYLHNFKTTSKPIPGNKSNFDLSEYQLKCGSDIMTDGFFITVQIYYHSVNTRRNMSTPIDLRFCLKLILICLSGDVELNPGPVKVPCGFCWRPVAKNHRALRCTACFNFCHIRCAGVSVIDYANIHSSDDSWACKNCIGCPFTDSFFEEENLNISGLSLNENTTKNIFDTLIQNRTLHPRKFQLAHLNINSLRSKFVEIRELMSEKIVDALFLSETKLDDSYYNALFEVSGYSLHRKDRNSYGGGLAIYIRSDIPSRRRYDLEQNDIESIVLEVTLNRSKWCFIHAYRPPNKSPEDFFNPLEKCVDKCISIYDHYAIIGDLNSDLLSATRGRCLVNFSELFDLSQLVKDATCFMKNCTPSLLDIFLTNSKNLCIKIQNFPTGISDCHNMIALIINHTAPCSEKQKFTYRSFRNFDRDAFICDLQHLQLESDGSDLNSLYLSFEKDLEKIIDKHIPLKTGYRRQHQLPYMNRALRKAIMIKKMFYHKYIKNRSDRNWEKYRIQRNYVNKLKRTSLNNYFIERCTGGCRSVEFWDTIKPYFSKKGVNSKLKIILKEGDVLISKNENVADTFNSLYVNVANDIGKNYIFNPQNHPSLNKIAENRINQDEFSFKHVDEDTVLKIIKSFDCKKATGVDKISAKILKLSENALVPHFTTLINYSISHGIFPDRLKQAQVAPVFKKGDPLLKSNYRPVSILPNSSKIFEKVISQQLLSYFEPIFNNYLCAFRKGHGCQTTLLKLIEDWKSALDRNEYVAAVLMDLSKAFDCLPHEILLCKLASYGLSQNALNLISDYLSNRKQQVKIGNCVSQWADISKGVPQGSIIGPLLFNIFINDIFYFVKNCSLYNYADDNTLSCHNKNLNSLITTLENESNQLIEWFHFNKMKANPDKFQAIAIGKKTQMNQPTLSVSGFTIKCEDVVTLLGVDIDFKLSFENQVQKICRKAATQLNILKRIGKHLCKLSKLTIFHSFISSNFNFCSLSWHFCSDSNTKKIEKIQERALRFVYEDYTSSYKNLLIKANLPELNIRRKRTMALEIFKILNGIAPPVLSDLLHRKETKYNFRYSNILEIPRINTSTFGKNSFKYAAPVLWNSLPEHLRSITNFNLFKNQMSFWNGNTCKCTACRQ